MAAIMQEWSRIAHLTKEIGQRLDVQPDKVLSNLQGDMYARQGVRLTALANWLKAINAKMAALQAEAETQFEVDNAFDEEGESVTGEELEADLQPEPVEYPWQPDEAEPLEQAPKRRGGKKS